MPRAQPSASFEQALFYVEAPEIVVLAFGNRSKIIAVSTSNIAQHGFFGARVSNRQFEDYLNNRFDLRYLLGNPDRSAWYVFDLEDFEEKVDLRKVELTKNRREQFLPDHGFFARDHTEEYGKRSFVQRGIQRFDVDGNWDMKEFSKLHSQISDLYTLSHSVDRFEDQATDLSAKREIMEAFTKPWRGGGSYYGFFKSLSSGGRAARPDIRAIQWASPGYIDVTGDKEAFARLVRLVEHYSVCRHKANLQYQSLWNYLQDVRLLKRSSKDLDRKSDIALEIGRKAKELSRTLDISSYRTLKMMAGNDPVIAAKVLLAAKRRVDRLYGFFAEGRVSVKGAEIL